MIRIIDPFGKDDTVAANAEPGEFLGEIRLQLRPAAQYPQQAIRHGVHDRGPQRDALRTDLGGRVEGGEDEGSFRQPVVGPLQGFGARLGQAAIALIGFRQAAELFLKPRFGIVRCDDGVGNVIIQPRTAHRAGITDPAGLDRRIRNSNSGKPVARRVSLQVDENIDPAPADILGDPVIVHLADGDNFRLQHRVPGLLDGSLPRRCMAKKVMSKRLRSWARKTS